MLTEQPANTNILIEEEKKRVCRTFCVRSFPSDLLSAELISNEDRAPDVHHESFYAPNKIYVAEILRTTYIQLWSCFH